jgi:hypothetical protein
MDTAAKDKCINFRSRFPDVQLLVGSKPALIYGTRSTCLALPFDLTHLIHQTADCSSGEFRSGPKTKQFFGGKSKAKRAADNKQNCCAIIERCESQ